MGSEGDWLIGIGLLLVVVGPLFNLPIIWLLHKRFTIRLLQRSSIELSGENLGRLSLAASTALVVLILIASTMPGKIVFNDLCAQYGDPDIKERHYVDSFFAKTLFPYEATRYLTELGVLFIEAPDPYREGIFVRYFLGEGDQLVTEEISAPISRFEVRKEHREYRLDSSSIIKVIINRQTGEPIAQAATINFNGGPLSLLMGTASMDHCPNILTEAGSKKFQIFYKLEDYVLRYDNMQTHNR